MALIGYLNAVENAAVTLAASSASTGYSAEMLRIPLGAPSVAWQTAGGVTTASLTLTAPGALPWRVVCLARTNLTPSATIRVQAGAYDSGTVAAGVTVGIGQALHILPSEVSAAEMIITLADASNPDGLINVPLVYAGPAQSVAIGPASDTGRDVRRADTTTRGGTVIAQPLSAGRQWQIAVPFLRDADITWLDALEDAAAIGGNILFVPRESNTRAAAETILGLMSPARRGFLGPTGAFRSWAATIIERL
jgi:hypothetical protein